MLKSILITGKPRSGKSTLLERMVSRIPNKVGFLTKEMRVAGERMGFEIETHLGSKTVLAHVNSKTDYRVSRYFVDIRNLESIIPEVSTFGKGDILYLDEIGQMELFSEKFKDLVLSYFDSPNTCLAALSQVYRDEFTDNIRKRNDVFIVEISESDRGEKEKFIEQLLRKIGKARQYSTEPQRFRRRGSRIEMESEHDTRELVLRNGRWECSCNFFKQNRICSHSIVSAEIADS